MRRTNAESPDTFTAKLGFFDRTFAQHTDRLGVSCRVQADALIETGLLPINAHFVSNKSLSTCAVIPTEETLFYAF
jgi:hypothetical protein